MIMEIMEQLSGRCKIAVFGSANHVSDLDYQQQVKQLGTYLSIQDCDLVLGATTGLIGEFIAGVKAAPHKACQLQLVIYGDRRYLATDEVDQVMVKPCYFSRLQVLTDCDRYIVLDGQLGTLAEVLVSWNQLQATRAFERKIIVFGTEQTKKLQFLRDELIFSTPAYRDFIDFAQSARQVVDTLDLAQ